MTVTITFPPALEKRLRQQAASEGVDTEAYVLQAVESDLRRATKRSPQALSQEELHLLQDTNAGLAVETWKRYRKLGRRQRAGTITAKEHRELISLSDQIEMANANRLKVVIDYAHAHGVPFEEVLKKFEIGRLGNV